MKTKLARISGLALALAAALSLAAVAQYLSEEPQTNRRGSDYSSFRSGGLFDCKDACARDRRCRAYTFDGSASMCYLKDAVPDGSRDSRMTSGVKQPGGGRPPYGDDLTEERGIDYHGGDYTRFSSRGLEDCQDACRRDRRCVSYTYELRNATCYLKDRLGRYQRDPAMVSGVKRGYGPGGPGPGGGGGRDLTEEVGYDYYGSDYTRFQILGVGPCQDECRRDRRCAAYTYDTRERLCYLKDRVGDRRRNDKMVTGRKQGR